MGVVECVCECVQSKVYLPVRRLDSLVMRPSRRASAECIFHDSSYFGQKQKVGDHSIYTSCLRDLDRDNQVDVVADRMI